MKKHYIYCIYIVYILIIYIYTCISSRYTAPIMDQYACCLLSLLMPSYLFIDINWQLPYGATFHTYLSYHIQHIVYSILLIWQLGLQHPVAGSKRLICYLWPIRIGRELQQAPLPNFCTTSPTSFPFYFWLFFSLFFSPSLCLSLSVAGQTSSRQCFDWHYATKAR